ncbi:MAG: hypothetical protein WD691_01620 [Acidimicrobiales bacterium]
MSEAPDRIEQFKTDIADLRIADPSTARDRVAVRLGLAGLTTGIVLPIVAYSMSHGTTDALAQRDALVLALIGVAVAIAGSSLYLKGALAGFLRFWLVRDLHERRAQTDRLIDHIAGRDRSVEGELT